MQKEGERPKDKMNKKNIIFIVSIVVLLSLSLSGLAFPIVQYPKLNPLESIAFYNMNETSGGLLNQVNTSYTLLNVGSPSYRVSSPNTTDFWRGIKFDDVDPDYFYNDTFYDFGAFWSVSVWLYNNLSTEQHFLGTDPIDWIRQTALGTYTAKANDYFSGNIDTNCNDLGNEWCLFTFICNDHNMTVYVNDNKTSWSIANAGIGCSVWGTSLYVGYDTRAAGSNYDGMMSQLLIFNKSLSAGEIELIYKGDWFVPPPTSPTLNITATAPLPLTQWNTQLININATVTSSTNFNCSMYINGTLNQTQNNTFAGINVSVNFKLNFNEKENGIYNYSFFCNNSVDIVSTTQNTFIIDNVYPLIWTQFKNASIYILRNLTGQFNFSDTFLLYSYNFSIDNNPIIGAINLNVRSYNYTLNYPIQNLSTGLHTFSVRVADGHTAKEIPDYEVKTGFLNNYLNYITPDGVDIKIDDNDGGAFSSFSTKKSKDRYTFDFTPTDKPKNKYTFTITSNEKINIINTNTKYQNYLIIGDHWLDFYMPEENEHLVSINKVSDYIAEVTISGFKKTDKLKFSSIGDLNIVEYNYSFTKVNATFSYPASVTETESFSTYVNFDITGTGLTSTNFTTVALNYSDLSGTLLKTTDDATYVKYLSTLIAPNIVDPFEQKMFNWSVIISGNEEMVAFNHTVFKVLIDDCSLHVGNNNWSEALNFLSLDEEKNDTDYINDTTLNIDFNVWVTDESSYKNFSFGFVHGYNYSICIYPNSSSYLVNAVAEYFAPDKANRKYYLDNYYLNSTPRTIYLYNLNSSKASDITFRVYDKNTAENVPGAYIKILRYYPETGQYKVVEIEKTDANGYTLGKMVLADVFYKFIVETDRTVRLNTNVERIISLTKNLGITQESDLLESWRQIGDVNTLVSCNNNTKVCLFTWSDSNNLVQTGVLRVYRLSSTGRKLLNEQTLNAVAGTLTYTITENVTGKNYVAFGYLHTNTANSFYEVGEAYIEFVNDMRDMFGVSAVFPVLLLLISLGAVFLDIGAVGVVAGSMIGIIFMVMIGIVPIGITTVVSILICGGILIAKLRA